MIERWAVVTTNGDAVIYKREEVARAYAEKFFGSARVVRLIEAPAECLNQGDAPK